MFAIQYSIHPNVAKEQEIEHTFAHTQVTASHKNELMFMLALILEVFEVCSRLHVGLIVARRDVV